MDWTKIGLGCVKAGMDAVKNVKSIKATDPKLNIQTNADIASHEAILAYLKSQGVNCNLYSEESDEVIPLNEGDEDVTVILDPIDNTYMFYHDEVFFSSVAMMILIKGEPHYSFIGDLATGDVYHCDPNAAYKNGAEIRIGGKRDGRGIILAWAPYSPRIEEFDKLRGLANKDYLLFNYGGQLQAVKILTGNYDAYLEVIPEVITEFCAAVIVKRAGGFVSTLEGEDLSFVPTTKQTLIIARDEKVYNDIMEEIKG